MLPRLLRLSRAEIKVVLVGGRSTLGGPLALRFRRDQGAKLSKFAVVVSVRVAPSAVKRHQLKRHLRELIQSMTPLIKPGYQVIIFTTPAAAKLSFRELQATLEALFRVSHLIDH